MAGKWPPIEVHYDSHRFTPFDELPVSPTATAKTLREVCEQLGVELVASTANDLTRTCRAEDHQGLCARMPEFPYHSLAELLATESSRHFVILDGIQDSFNLGAIIRSAEALGCGGVILPAKGQAGINSQSARSSAGAVNWLPICRVDRLDEAAGRLKAVGSTLLAATEKSDLSLWNVAIPRRVTIVIGNEGKGVSEELLSHCDLQVRVPMSGITSSLNAAVAAGIMLAEVSRQAGLPTSSTG